jgi:hypothetical protein
MIQSKKAYKDMAAAGVSIIILVFFIVIIATSGLIENVSEAFSVFGPLGGLLGFLFILMILLAILKNIGLLK